MKKWLIGYLFFNLIPENKRGLTFHTFYFRLIKNTKCKKWATRLNLMLTFN